MFLTIFGGNKSALKKKEKAFLSQQHSVKTNNPAGMKLKFYFLFSFFFFF